MIVRGSGHRTWIVPAAAAMFMLTAGDSHAQRTVADSQRSEERAHDSNVLTRLVTVDLKQVSLREAVTSITRSASVRVQYQAHLLNTSKPRVTLRADKMPLGVALERILAGTSLHAIPTGNDLITVKPIDGTSDSLNAPQKGTPVPGKRGSIRGKVIDSLTKQGVGGATVVVAGNKIAASTSDDGSFYLADVPAGTQSITVRLLGYHNRTISVPVNSDTPARINVQLQATSTTLTEVVTTATGSQRRAEISNDVVKIDAEKLIEVAPIRNVTDLLIAAQVPGMFITPSTGEPGAPARIRLGGPGSISQNNDPVVIVDGVWIRSAFSDSSIRRKLPTSNISLLPSRLDAIDPATIESIEIVRGPSAASLYGPDAANGVIKITTKRGRPGPARWDVRVFRDWSNPVGQQPNWYQGYGHAPNSNVPAQCNLNDVFNGVCVQDSIVVVDKNSPLVREEGKAFTDGFSVSINGGSGSVSYVLSGSAQDQTSVRRMAGGDIVRARQLNLDVPGQFLTPGRLSTRSMSTTLGLAPRPQLEVRVNVGGTQRNTRDNNFQVRTLGSFRVDDTLSTLVRPLTPNRSRAYVATTSLLANVNMNWNPRPWWSGNVTFGLDQENNRENRNVAGFACVNGVCNRSSSSDATADRQTSIYTARFQSTLIPNLGWASRFLALRPGVTMDLKREVRASGDLSEELLSVADPSKKTLKGSRKIGPNIGLAGVGVNMYIRVFDRLSFDPGFRRDFGTKVLQNNAKTYPRFGTSWMVSDESFFPKTGLVTSFRLRSALGYAAVQPQISSVRGLYHSAVRTLDGIIAPIALFSGTGNPKLEPERSFEIEGGFDADLLNDRVTLVVTHTNKQNRNTLIDRSLAPSAGTGTGGKRKENVARVVNTRTDLQVMARVFERPAMSARVSANFSFADNRIKTLGDGVSPFGGTEQRYVEGYPVGGLWSREIVAVADVNNNGVIEWFEMVMSDSAVYVGTNLPRMTAGYSIEATIRNLFTVNTMFNYKGRTMQNRSSSISSVRGYWDPTVPVAEQMLAQILQLAGGYDRQNYTELRLQSASVTMNAPTVWANRLKAKTLQISLQGSNLGLWTTYRGRDPAVNSTPVGEQTTDRSELFPVIPEPRSFSLQVRFGY